MAKRGEAGEEGAPARPARATAAHAASAAPRVLPALHPDHVRAIANGTHPQPHATLGQHPVDGGFVIRAVRPLAATVTAVRADGTRVSLDHLSDGLWQGFVPGAGQAYSL